MIDEGFREQEAHVADYSAGLLGPGGVLFGMDSILPIGSIQAWAGVNLNAVPAGWLKCDGAAYNRVDYPDLWASLAYSLTSPVTLTIASPGVVNATAHGFSSWTRVVLRTTGALPTGLTPGTIYYISSTGFTANSFQLTTVVGAASINFTGTQSGVHTLWHAPYGDGDGVNTFNVPDLRGRVIAGMDWGAVAQRLAWRAAGGIVDWGMGNVGGEESHVLVTGEMPSHTHSHNHAVGGALVASPGAGSGVRVLTSVAGGTSNVNTDTDATSAGSGIDHNNVPPTIILNYLIWAGA